MTDRKDPRVPWQPVVAEFVGTALLVLVGLSVVILMFFLYAVMVSAEAAVSGTSTNPARSLGPAIISGAWDGWWIYWVGPVIGTLAAILACSFLAKRIEVAKLYHFESDRRRLFHTRNP